MSHKVHPKSYRLRKLEDWSSRWFDKKGFSQNLEEDFKIRRFLDNKIGKLGVEKIEIERFAGKIIIIVLSSRPGLIIGRGGTGVEDLKKQLDKIIEKGAGKKELRIEIKEIRDPWSSASLAGQWIAQQLERRTPHRRVLKQALSKIMASKANQGARIEISGRLGGTEIARKEWLAEGRMPRQTIRADIDFVNVRANTTYGVIGVKVWLYKGEKFD